MNLLLPTLSYRFIFIMSTLKSKKKACDVPIGNQEPQLLETVTKQTLQAPLDPVDDVYENTEHATDRPHIVEYSEKLRAWEGFIEIFSEAVQNDKEKMALYRRILVDNPDSNFRFLTPEEIEEFDSWF